MTTTIPTLDQPLITLNEQDFLAFADNAIAVIETATDERTLQELRVSLSGKKSALTALSKQMGALDADTKKQYGVYLHELRTHINQALETKAKQLATAAMNAKLASEQIDIGLPARGILSGGLHPITQTTERMKQFFVQAGFSVATGPEIESDYYNFEALNIASYHPACAMHNTFYFNAQ